MDSFRDFLDPFIKENNKPPRSSERGRPPEEIVPVIEHEPDVPLKERQERRRKPFQDTHKDT